MTQAPRRFGKMDTGDFVPYQISQRADFIQTDIYEWVQFNRALINARDEPLADYRRFRRLHLLLGDSNLLPFANALKVGTTALMLDLLEADALPDIALYEPVCAMRKLSHQPNGPWESRDGRPHRAVCARSARRVPRCRHLGQDRPRRRRQVDRRGMALRPDQAAQRSRGAHRQARLDHEAVPARIVREIGGHHLARYVAREPRPRISFGRSVEIASRRPARNRPRPAGLARPGKRDFFISPPPNTRANLRSEAMRTILHKKLSYVIDWDLIYIGEGKQSTSTTPSSTTCARSAASVRRSIGSPRFQ